MTLCEWCFPHLVMPAPHHWIFTGRMLFLMPNQQHQSTDGKKLCPFVLFITTTLSTLSTIISPTQTELNTYTFRRHWTVYITAAWIRSGIRFDDILCWSSAAGLPAQSSYCTPCRSKMWQGQRNLQHRQHYHQPPWTNVFSSTTTKMMTTMVKTFWIIVDETKTKMTSAPQ